MLGDAVLYAASRATHSAIENVSRRATWAAIAGAFLLSALVLGLIAAFLLMEPRLGALTAIGALASSCVLAGIISLAVPVLVDKYHDRRRFQSAGAVTAVNQEAKEVVDYFGAMQVVGAAFLFGLGAARRLKR